MLNTSDLLSDMKSKGVDVDVRSHAPVFNMAESGELDLGMDGERCKNLFLCDKKGRKFLVVTSAHKALDLQALRPVLESGRVSMGSHEQLFSSLGVKSGALSPLALINDHAREIELVIDSELKNAEYFLLHPLCNEMTLRVSVNNLIDYLESIGHSAKWVLMGSRV